MGTFFAFLQLRSNDGGAGFVLERNLFDLEMKNANEGSTKLFVSNKVTFVS